jgi:uncharacterized OB-fold protein
MSEHVIAHNGVDWTESPGYLVPRSTPEATEFFAGTLREELRIQRCRACGLHQHYPRIACSHCGSPEIEWVTASGRGTIHSFTVIRQNGVPPFNERVPFVVALVELEEAGARILASMPTLAPDDVRIGMNVEAVFRPGNEHAAFVDFAVDRASD